jgi:hypothetical protein
MADTITQRTLWRDYLALAVSDMAMAIGDPLANTTISHLPAARTNLAAFGVGLSLAILVESPVIMILHAANALAPSVAGRRALWRLVLIGCVTLTVLMLLATVPPVFRSVVAPAMGLQPDMAEPTRRVMQLLALWPAAIGWRRYFQGLLIHAGHMRAVALAGGGRLLVLGITLYVGFTWQAAGAVVAAAAMALSVIAEALCVSLAAWHFGVRQLPDTDPERVQPQDLAAVWRFYRPLASAMLVIWGGRALYIAAIARAVDGPLALAAWPVAMCVVVLVANATRMVQQVVIRYRTRVPSGELWRFALSVGAAATATLFLISATPLGAWAVASFVGQDAGLRVRVAPVLLTCSIIPLLAAAQSALQGLLIGSGDSGAVYRATWLAVSVQAIACLTGVALGMPGALAAGVALVIGFSVEVAVLARQSGKLGWLPSYRR